MANGRNPVVKVLIGSPQSPQDSDLPAILGRLLWSVDRELWKKRSSLWNGISHQKT